jgi:hypothetical protein
MCAVWKDAGVRATPFAVRCCVFLFGFACTAAACAADERDDTDEIQKPLCRRARDLQLASGWRFKLDLPALVQTTGEFGAMRYSARKTFEHAYELSWSEPTAFRFDRDLNDWHRLRVYGSRNAVRVVTLWDSEYTTLALQTNKHGDPMLRWTSKAMSRGEASRGLLDEWLSPRDSD